MSPPCSKLPSIQRARLGPKSLASASPEAPDRLAVEPAGERLARGQCKSARLPGVSVVGAISQAWRYPVKSMQGLAVQSLRIGPTGIEGDRRRAIVDLATGRVMSAKRTADLLFAHASDDTITLPDGTLLDVDAPDIDDILSNWLGREVTLRSAEHSRQASYEMTFDPPDDSSEYFEIPIPDGTFLDLAPVHLVATATLDACAGLRPDLDWSPRRFRPNLILRAEGEAFVEDTWSGRQIAIGTAVLHVSQPTVRCAMPLRPQPALGPDEPALGRQAELFRALSDLNPAMPNHLGAYANVVTPGSVSVGDAVRLLDADGG